jgi:hypothetical protein
MIVRTTRGYAENERDEEDEVPDDVIKAAAAYCHESGNTAFVGYDETIERWHFCDDEDIGRVDSFAFGWPCDEQGLILSSGYTAT